MELEQSPDYSATAARFLSLKVSCLVPTLRLKPATHAPWLVIGMIWIAAGCAREAVAHQAAVHLAPPRGLPDVPIPVGNLLTQEKIDLGRWLFYERRVAAQPQSACVDCHVPEAGYAGLDAAMSFHRRAPTVLNRAYGDYEFWDGSAGRSMEEVVRGVLHFVNFGADEPAWTRLGSVPGYRRAFTVAFGRPIDEDAVVDALACYSRTLLAGDSPEDRFSAGDRAALSPKQQRGRELFYGAAGCGHCHSGPNFTDESFHVTGIGQDHPLHRYYADDPHGKPEFPELGKFNVTGRLADRGAFKTPTVRELARRRFYMHDGSLHSLAEVVAYYNRGGTGVLGIDPAIHPLALSAEQQDDLVAFLGSLSSSQAIPAPPELPE